MSGRVIATHHVDGCVAQVGVVLPERSVVACGATTSVSMDIDDWRRTAKAALAECNAAERAMEPDDAVARVVAQLDEVAKRTAAERGDLEPVKMRMALHGAVLRRLSDILGAGRLAFLDASYVRDGEADEVHTSVAFRLVGDEFGHRVRVTVAGAVLA